MVLAPQVLTALATSCGVGYLMIRAGLDKNMLERRKPGRICPACGRRRPFCGC